MDLNKQDWNHKNQFIHIVTRQNEEQTESVVFCRYVGKRRSDMKVFETPLSSFKKYGVPFLKFGKVYGYKQGKVTLIPNSVILKMKRLRKKKKEPKCNTSFGRVGSGKEWAFAFKNQANAYNAILRYQKFLEGHLNKKTVYDLKIDSRWINPKKKFNVKDSLDYYLNEKYFRNIDKKYRFLGETTHKGFWSIQEDFPLNTYEVFCLSELFYNICVCETFNLDEKEVIKLFNKSIKKKDGKYSNNSLCYFSVASSKFSVEDRCLVLSKFFREKKRTVIYKNFIFNYRKGSDTISSKAKDIMDLAGKEKHKETFKIKLLGDIPSKGNWVYGWFLGDSEQTYHFTFENMIKQGPFKFIKGNTLKVVLPYMLENMTGKVPKFFSDENFYELSFVIEDKREFKKIKFKQTLISDDTKKGRRVLKLQFSNISKEVSDIIEQKEKKLGWFKIIGKSFNKNKLTVEIDIDAYSIFDIFGCRVNDNVVAEDASKNKHVVFAA